MAKRKLHPALKAYSSCVKELKINPRMMRKGAKGAAAVKKRLKACAEKKLRMMKR